MSKGFFVSVIVWLIVTFVFNVKLVFGHGDHGNAAPPVGGISLVSFDGYQLELLTAPRPPRVAEENQIVIKILRDGSLEPARDGKVLIGVAPARFSSNQSSHTVHSAGMSKSEAPIALARAKELVWAGNYTSTRDLERSGPHVVRVALVELDGKKYDPPAVFEFFLNVAPGSGPSLGFISLLLLVSAVGVVAIYWAAARARFSLEQGAPVNVLDLPWLGRWVRSKWFLPGLQVPVLALTIALAILGFVDVQDGGQNLATKVTWIIWWPGIIFTFIVVGRLWCVMCPFGTLNDWAAKLSRTQRMFPRVLRNLWLATLFFVLLTWADEMLGVIRSPLMTAWLILLLGSLAVLTGLLYQRRSFCRYLCPITGLQGLYSMVSPFELRARDRSTCLRDCHQDCYRGNERGSGCPMFEFPMTLERNTYCNLCFECVKSCPPQNLVLRAHAFGKDLWASARRSLDESYLALALVGITTVVTAQMLTAWSGWISWLARFLPLTVRTSIKPVTYLTLTESAVFIVGSLVLYPLSGYVVSWLADRRAGEKRKGIRRTFVALGYMFIPLGLSMHLAHNVSHLLSEGPGVVPAVQRTLNRYLPFDLGEPGWDIAPLVSADVIHGLQMVLVIGGFLFSLIVGYRLGEVFFGGGKFGARALAPLIALSLVFTLINLVLLNQPMGMRHGM
ncbi:MAG: 4Fe-4S binding protein [Deltaproteobacteria bacterium]|nr:4Fe-4S binding protein [Deltaproteobacteria bacterium]